MKQNSTIIEKLRNEALQSALEWAQFTPLMYPDASDDVIAAHEKTLRQIMESNFDKYTLAKSDFDPQECGGDKLIVCFDRMEEAMKLIIEASRTLLIDQLYKLTKVLVEICENDKHRWAD